MGTQSLVGHYIRDTRDRVAPKPIPRSSLHAYAVFVLLHAVDPVIAKQ